MSVKRRIKCGRLVGIGWLVCACAWGKTVRVAQQPTTPDGPADFVGTRSAAIQRGIDAALGVSDKVYIYDGVYIEVRDCPWAIEDADDSTRNTYMHNYVRAVGSVQNVLYVKDNVGREGEQHRICYNVLEGPGTGAGVYLGEDAWPGSQNRLWVLNNTFVNLATGMKCGLSVECRVHNNIFSGVPEPIRGLWGMQNTGAPVYSYGNNLASARAMLRASDGKPWVDNGGNLTGADPSFAGSGSESVLRYRLQPGSAAIDAASSAWDCLPDMLGHGRTGAAIDIGALEYWVAGQGGDAATVGRRVPAAARRPSPPSRPALSAR
ncbi:MAG: hypothetical protein JXR37_13940 [Kiritimatiellae bacterium]|nr:hypothetical protein [Kiritimatiellia bacterium]